ncbi:hypothetical protein PV336_27335 [Streptomyces sp. MI02-2A]|uniref:hypothetical protein n=1 Tax=Streptomyces sp. MI02-2A TaxID=3028688 RepID=UPI0029BBC684|nr:hypothetical protein [Streptomyces sp. MI02-2A]MDX3262897.1 hypothetical protein [Streptomyces sp. MI02-2A]
MTTPPPRSPRLLLITTVLLALAGTLLLALPHNPDSPAARPPTAAQGRPPASTTPARRLPPAGRPAGTAPATSSAASPSGAALPPHGDGAAGDRAIQEALEAAWPADLPAGDARHLLAVGRALLRADATGVGRTAWPALFPDRKQTVAPPAFTRFRIQAGIARRGPRPGQAVVHLVWAGADHGGTYTDGRITDWYFTHTRKGGSAWTVQPPRT